MQTDLKNKNQTKDVSENKAIIGFCDILGYDTIVKKMIKNSEFIKNFDTLMHKLTVELLQKLKNLNISDLTGNPADNAYFKKVTNTIKVRCIFDNAIFSLPLSSITFNSQEFDNKTTILNCIETFFSSIAMFSAFFISFTGYTLRGGISIGSHYEIERDNYLFIFSEAHNKAVHLEKDATNPRILLEDDLRLYLDEMSYSHMNKSFYKDDDGSYCLDIYSFLETMGNIKNILTDINKGLILNMESNTSNIKELSKLIYFAKYHNRKIGSNGLKFPELSINIDKFVKIVGAKNL
jgi:hypothetical protein